MQKKTVLITGASRGIGKSMAELFAKNGYNVCADYLKSEHQAYKLRELINKEGYSLEVCRADVSNSDDVKKLFDYCIDIFGGIDVLINNAGIAESALFTDITEKQWDNMLNVHVKGTFLCSKQALLHMIPKKSGKIINISSIWGLIGASCEVHYSTAKSAIIGLTKALSKEVAPSGINVNAIAPGAIDTDMLSELSDEDIDSIKEQTPLGKIGSPIDIANMALYLASDKSDFITGQIFSVNGGFVI